MFTVKTVELQDTDNAVEAFDHVTLLMATLVHECIEKKEYDQAMQYVKMMNEASMQLLYAIANARGNVNE